MYTSKDKDVPDQRERTLRSRRSGVTVPGPAVSSFNDGLLGTCTAGVPRDSASAGAAGVRKHHVFAGSSLEATSGDLTGWTTSSLEFGDEDVMDVDVGVESTPVPGPSRDPGPTEPAVEVRPRGRGRPPTHGRTVGLGREREERREVRLAEKALKAAADRERRGGASESEYDPGSDPEVIRPRVRRAPVEELPPPQLEDELAVLSTVEVLGRTHLELEAVDRVAQRSKNLKGGSVRALKDATNHVRVILETLDGRLRNDPRFTSAPAPSRVFLENQELRAEVAQLRAEVAALRDGARMPPPPPPPPVGGKEGLSEESLLKKVEALLERKLAGVRTPAPVSGDRGNVPAAKRKGGRKTPAPAKSRSASRGGRGGAVPGPSAQDQPGTSAEADPGSTSWAEVVGRRAKRRAKAQAKPAVQPFSQKKGGPGAKGPVPKARGGGGGGARARSARRARVPRTAAISLTAVREGASLADAMKEFRTALPDVGKFGITQMMPKRSFTGGLLILVSGEGREEKAAALSSWMKGHAEKVDLGVKVGCPTKTGEVRVVGFDSSVTPEEIKASLAQAGGCSAESVRVGTIRTTPGGSCACWAQCPIAAARKLSLAGKVKVGGWFSASVEALPPRPLRCFKCLCTGHVQRYCTSKEDRSGRCFRCGTPGHDAGACKASEPKCPLCSDLGIRANHRMGGPSCNPPRQSRPRSRWDLPRPGAARTSSSVPEGAGGEKSGATASPRSDSVTKTVDPPGGPVPPSADPAGPNPVPAKAQSSGAEAGPLKRVARSPKRGAFPTAPVSATKKGGTSSAATAKQEAPGSGNPQMARVLAALLGSSSGPKKSRPGPASSKK